MNQPAINRIGQIGRIFFACAMVWLVSAPAWACPNCGEGMGTDPAQAGLVRGIFWSILFLLSMPFLIFAGLAGYFYWLIRSARRIPPTLGAAAEVVAETTSNSPFLSSSSATKTEVLETADV